MVNVYDDDGNVIAQVEYNNALDYWDGNNFTCGSAGHHKGITKLEDGRYVIIYGTQWQGERNYAKVVSDKEALQEILKSGNEKLLDNNKYVSLKKLMEENLIKEA